MINRDELSTFARGLTTLESIALIGSVVSTNELGRRIVGECIENDIPLPQAIIVAREQRAGRGRGANSWQSPAGRGIYATILITRPKNEIAQLPMEIAVTVATTLRNDFGVDAEIKWPNDILVAGRKIAGILIEARFNNGDAYLAIGIGINARPIAVDVARTTSIEECTGEEVNLDDATRMFVAAMDRALAHVPSPGEVHERWNQMTVHRDGEEVAATIGDRRVQGLWSGIDDHGRATIRSGNETIHVSAGELIRIE